MATAIDLTLASLTAYAPAQRVYTKHAWRDDWTVVPYLHCTSAQRSCAPDIGQAHFLWRYGRGMQAGGAAFYDWPRLTYCTPSQTVDVSAGRLGRFVKVEFDVIDSGSTVTRTWFGYLLDSDEMLEGCLNLPPIDDQTDDPIRIPSGTQRLVGYELSWLLTEINVDSAVVATTADVLDRVAYPIGFNMHKGGPRDSGAFEVKNRSANRYPNVQGESYVFSHTLDPATAERWTTYDIVEYLLTWHSPLGMDRNTDAEHTTAVPFRIDQSGVHDDILRWEFPRLNCENRTVWDCITQVIDRRRSQGFYVDVDTASTPNAVVLYPFPYNAEPLTVTNPATGDLITIPANDNLRTLDIDNNHFADSKIRRSASAKYDEVLVRGGRRRSVFMANEDGSFNAPLVADWSGAEQTAYNTGASGAGDYPDRVSLRVIRNKQVRTDDSLARVYRYFKIDDEWNFKVASDYVMPLVYENGTVDYTRSEPMWQPGLRFLRHLPMFKGWDYSTDAANPTDGTGGAPLEYQESFLVFLMPPDGTGNAKYSYGHDLSESLRILAMAYQGPAFNVSIRPQDQGLGIVCDVSGDAQHMIASDEFTPLADAGDEDGHFDWKDDMYAVVCMEADCYCQAIWPPDLPYTDSGLLKRRLVLDAGDGYRLDYLVPGTVLRLDDGEDVFNPDGGFIRDDRADLLAMAEVAYEWYSRERVAIDLTIRALATGFSLGHLITTFGANETEETLNSVVTSIVWHLGSDPSDQPHTIIHTNYAELDPGSFVRGRRG